MNRKPVLDYVVVTAAFIGVGYFLWLRREQVQRNLVRGVAHALPFPLNIKSVRRFGLNLGLKFIASPEIRTALQRAEDTLETAA